MNRVQNFIRSQYGRILISILLGIGLASIFRRSCKGKSCIKFVSPNFEDVSSKIYSFNDKCYTYKANATSCNTSKRIIAYNHEDNENLYV